MWCNIHCLGLTYYLFVQEDINYGISSNTRVLFTARDHAIKFYISFDEHIYYFPLYDVLLIRHNLYGIFFKWSIHKYIFASLSWFLHFFFENIWIYITSSNTDVIFIKKSKVPCINLTFSGVLFLENIWQYRYMIELNLLELHMYIFTLLYIGSFYI